MNIAALERDYEKAASAAKDLYKKQSEQAEQEKRERTKEEFAEVEKLMTQAKGLRAKITSLTDERAMADEIEKLVGSVKTEQKPEPAASPENETRSMGQQWIESAAGKFFVEGRHRESQSWKSPSVELHAATLTTTGGSPGSGGDLIIPDFRPGILPLLFKRLVVADLIAGGRTTSNSIVYMKESTFTNAADVVAETVAKPESTLIFDQATDPVRKIAHWLPVSEEMLEDVPAIRSYIDARLRLGVELKEEDQLLNGSGSGENIRGLMNRTGLATTVVSGGSPGSSNADAIFTQMFSGIAFTAFIQPDGIIMNPTNWSAIALSKNADDQYYAGGPFNTPPIPRLWGLPVVLTPSIAAGTALVGAFRSAAQVFRKGGIRVEASNSHSDFFVTNKVAIRAEERLALAVYRPAAFGKVTLT